MVSVLDFEGAPIVPFASTFYEDPEAVRFGVAKQTVEAFHALGIPFVVVDASPEAEIGDELAERGATVIKAEQPGIAYQTLQGARFALDNGAKKLLRQEPEKVGMADFALDPVAEFLDKYDILVVGRTTDALRTHPTQMATIEETTNEILARLLGFPADSLSVVRGYSVRGAEVLLGYDVEQHGKNWEILHEPWLRGRQMGLNVGGLAVDLTYPPEMRAEEQENPAFDRKRFDQSLQQQRWALRQLGVELHDFTG